MDSADIQHDYGRYLQEYVESLENLPSEIAYHWAEIQVRNEQGQGIEKHMYSQQRDLAKIHRQWCREGPEKQNSSTSSREPTIVKDIQNDYDKLENLATERIQLADDALHLLDRHLSRLRRDLNDIDKNNPDARHHTSQQFDTRKRKSSSAALSDEDENYYDEFEEEEEEEDSVFDYEAMMEKRRQKQKKKEERDNEADNSLYCYCQQVSFGQMVACDGENCPYEWFHMECVGLDAPPKGAWYCDDCKAALNRRRDAKKMKQKLLV